MKTGCFVCYNITGTDGGRWYFEVFGIIEIVVVDSLRQKGGILDGKEERAEEA